MKKVNAKVKKALDLRVYKPSLRNISKPMPRNPEGPTARDWRGYSEKRRASIRKFI